MLHASLNRREERPVCGLRSGPAVPAARSRLLGDARGNHWIYSFHMPLPTRAPGSLRSPVTPLSSMLVPVRSLLCVVSLSGLPPSLQFRPASTGPHEGAACGQRADPL